MANTDTDLSNLMGKFLFHNKGEKVVSISIPRLTIEDFVSEGDPQIVFNSIELYNQTISEGKILREYSLKVRYNETKVLSFENGRYHKGKIKEEIFKMEVPFCGDNILPTLMGRFDQEIVLSQLFSLLEDAIPEGPLHKLLLLKIYENDVSFCVKYVNDTRPLIKALCKRRLKDPDYFFSKDPLKKELILDFIRNQNK